MPLSEWRFFFGLGGGGGLLKELTAFPPLPGSIAAAPATSASGITDSASEWRAKGRRAQQASALVTKTADEVRDAQSEAYAFEQVPLTAAANDHALRVAAFSLAFGSYLRDQMLAHARAHPYWPPPQPPADNVVASPANAPAPATPAAAATEPAAASATPHASPESKPVTAAPIASPAVSPVNDTNPDAADYVSPFAFMLSSHPSHAHFQDAERREQIYAR